METEKMIEALKPCPFCCGVHIRQYKDRTWYRITCDQCGANGGVSNHADVSAGMWNRRAEAALSTDAEPVAFTSQGQLDEVRKGSTALLYGKRDEFMDIALFTAPPAPSVAVKALEWQKDAGKPDDLYVVAKSVVGLYRISPQGREGFELRLFCADQFPIYASLAEAQAAAQADYEARVRSALSAQVQDVALPDGWQLVPKEATNAMMEAWGKDRVKTGSFFSAYRAMLAAAPAAKQGEAE